MKKPSFVMTVEIDDETGETLAAYFRIREGKVKETIELANGRAHADYDASGNLLGIEVLAPCNIGILDKLTEGEPAPIQRFLRESAPRALVS